MTPIETLSPTKKALIALYNNGIESVEALGNLTPAQVYKIMPYCHALNTLSQHRQWFNRRYPSPPPLPKRDGSGS